MTDDPRVHASWTNCSNRILRLKRCAGRVPSSCPSCACVGERCSVSAADLDKLFPVSDEPNLRTAGALSDDLGRFVRHEPIHPRPAGLLERVLRWVWRHRPFGSVKSGR